MNTTLLMVIIITILIGEAYMFSLLKHDKIELKYTLAWIIGGFVLIFFSFFSDLLIFITHLFRVYEPVNFIYFLGFIYVLGILLSLTIALSRNSSRVKMLAQKYALLDEKLRKNELIEVVFEDTVIRMNKYLFSFKRIVGLKVSDNNLNMFYKEFHYD